MTLALAALLAFSPFFFSAQTATEGCWTGWQARIQYRPQVTSSVGLSPYIWAGGYLSDGTFLQAGISATPEQPAGFAWRIAYGKQDEIAWRDIPVVPGSWHLFRAIRTAGIWTIRMDGRVIARYDSPSCLSVFSAVTETWDEQEPGPGVAAFQWLRVRTTDGRWIVPPGVEFGPPTCGAEAVSRVPGNLVIRPSADCIRWRQLWR